MESNYTMFENSMANNEMKKKHHIPFLDVDDLAYKSRQHDPSFIASITNIMQVPTTITLNNGNSSQHLGQRSHSNNYYVENATFAMEMPDKLTILADNISKSSRADNQDSAYSPNDSMLERMKENDFASNGNLNDTNHATATPPSTPTRTSFRENIIFDENLSKTPQIAADLYQRMRPRRSSLEMDLQAEIRTLRDRLNHL